MPLLGAHESVAGGLHLAFDRIHDAGGQALQIFTRNQRQWNPKPLDDSERHLFHDAWQRHPAMAVAAHGSYLINLASAKEELIHKSVSALGEELDRCHLLEIPLLIIHPGSHGGDGREQGIARVIKHLDLALGHSENQVQVLLETTAGQGTGLGSSFEELAAMIAGSRYPERLGVCIDTCHIFAAGYDIRSKEAYLATMDDCYQRLGKENIKFFHLNDSQKALGSRVDRHQHIGQGHIGLEGFRNLLNDPNFRRHPMTLETPKGKDLQEDRDNLAVLRGLLDAEGPGAPDQIAISQARRGT